MKNVIVCGAGEVGRHACEVLVEQHHSVTVIDTSSEKLRSIEDAVDVTSIKGSSCHPDILQDANITQADLLIAATDQDEVNILTAALSKKLGVKKAVARLHHRSYLTRNSLDFRDLFGIDTLICPERLTSQAITAKLADPGVVSIHHFFENKIEMHRYAIKQGSKVLTERLAEINLPSYIRVALVNRNGESFLPSADTRFEEGDEVTLIGEPNSFAKVQSIFDQPIRNKKIAVLGGTSLGEWLAEDLAHRQFAVRLFETDHPRAVELSEKYPDITVINADPNNPTEFEEEQLDKCAAFCAVSHDDEHNILGALQAKQLGVPISCAVVHSPTYLSLLENLGIDLPFSPRVVAAKSLLNMVDEKNVKVLLKLGTGTAVVYEVGPVTAGDAVNLTLKEAGLPKSTFIAAIQRGDEVHVPGADDRVECRDLLLVVGPANLEKSLNKLFIHA